MPDFHVNFYLTYIPQIFPRGLFIYLPVIMEIQFYKYHGTGNDFVLIDNRQLNFPKEDVELIARICKRRFGVGADGLILLEKHELLDFTMVYYNSDGNLSTMCGNGGRCLVHFAKFLGIISTEARFMAIDGPHYASITDDEVSLQMKDVEEIQIKEDYVFVDTGSPHHVEIVFDLKNYNVKEEGRQRRFNVYGDEGSNINFVSPKSSDIFSVRTYERGVEDETLSCGTGVTAVALAMFASGKAAATEITLETPGGNLNVKFEKVENGFKNIFLIGPAVQVYKGIWKI